MTATAGMVSNAGRWASVSADSPQHLVSASTIRSGASPTMYSVDSWG